MLKTFFIKAFLKVFKTLLNRQNYRYSQINIQTIYINFHTITSNFSHFNIETVL